MNDDLTAKPKVYLFAAGSFGPSDLSMVSMADDGEVIVQHICSSRGWGRHDLHDASWRHSEYVRKYGAWGAGDRYELVECEGSDVPAEVFERNRQLNAMTE